MSVFLYYRLQAVLESGWFKRLLKSRNVRQGVSKQPSVLGTVGSAHISPWAGRLLHATHRTGKGAEHQAQAGLHCLRLCELQTSPWDYTTARRLHKIHVHGCKTMQVVVRMHWVLRFCRYIYKKQMHRHVHVEIYNTCVGMCVYMHRMIFTPLNFTSLKWENGHTCLSTCLITRERPASSGAALTTPPWTPSSGWGKSPTASPCSPLRQFRASRSLMFSGSIPALHTNTQHQLTVPRGYDSLTFHYQAAFNYR